MKFLLDAQLSRRLIGVFNEYGHEAAHASRMLRGFKTDDEAIAEFADKHGWIVVSKDSDFVDLHLISGTPQKLLAIRTGNTSNQVLRDIFTARLPEVVSAFAQANYIEIYRDVSVFHTPR